MTALLPILLAAGTSRTAFEWGRIQTETDWLAPIAVFVVIVGYVVWMYRRDTVELRPGAGVLLAALRILALVGLLVVYLQPQWRNEKDLVTNSRAILLVDTSLSMGLADGDGSPVPDEPSRAQKVIAMLERGPLLQRLREKHDVVVVRFDQDTARIYSGARLPRSGEDPGGSAVTDDFSSNRAHAADAAQTVDWGALLAPRGSETRLGQALRHVLDEERGAPLAGIIVVTDGQHNAGVEPAVAIAAAQQGEVPIFAVGMGSDARPANVRISDLVAPARAYPGDAFTVTGYLQGQAMAGKTVTVELFSRAADSSREADGGGLLEGVEQVTLGSDGQIVPVRFQLTSKEVGRRTLRLRIKAPPTDRNTSDNQQEVDLEIVDRQTRVLLFAGGPTREYQFLRNQLKRDKDVIVDVLLQTAQEGISQDASQILEDFPATREQMYAYDCVVAFDPDWRELDGNQIACLESWVGDQAGGLIVIAGPVYTDLWTQDARLDKVRALYPVEFHRRFALLEDARFGSKEPWPLDFTREGLEAEFLWLADSAGGNALAWSEFAGVYGHYAVRGPKAGAAVLARFSDPRAAEGGQLPAYMATQFFGAGRVFYLGSGEMWRLRASKEGYFERFYTQLIRHVSQGRLLRGSSRGVLLVQRDRYLLGNMVDVRAQLTDARLEPLAVPNVPLQVFLPDSTLQTVVLAADGSRPGSYRGQFPVRKEGTFRLELTVPESADEKLARRIQVRVPDVERENPQRNDALLKELSDRTSGAYYVGLEAAVAVDGSTQPVFALLRDRSRTTTQVVRPDRLWDNWWMLCGICGVLSLEWLLRRLMRLA